MARIQTLSKSDIQRFEDLHNVCRNKLASGRLNFKSAAKMATVSFDPELAFLAAINVGQCQMVSDDCHAKNVTTKPGQNMYRITSKKRFYRNKIVIRMAVSKWFLEYKNTKQSELSVCCGSPDIS